MVEEWSKFIKLSCFLFGNLSSLNSLRYTLLIQSLTFLHGSNALLDSYDKCILRYILKIINWTQQRRRSTTTHTLQHVVSVHRIKILLWVNFLENWIEQQFRIWCSHWTSETNYHFHNVGFIEKYCLLANIVFFPKLWTIITTTLLHCYNV